MWNTDPVDLELKDDAKPMCLKTHPVTRVHKAMFKRGLDILVILGVLEEENYSEWVAPSSA